MSTIEVRKTDRNTLQVTTYNLKNELTPWFAAISTDDTGWDFENKCYTFEIPAVFETAITAFADMHQIRLVSKVNGDTCHETYEEYQLRWMAEHGYSLYSLMCELGQMQYEDPEDSDRISTPIPALYDEWEMDRGFGGEIWACRAEWKKEEKK